MTQPAPTADPVTRTESFARTADGHDLSILRINVDPSVAHRPVLMVHGLGGNRRGFDIPGRSLAEYLAVRGFDCFLVDLRGSGASQATLYDHTLSDFIYFDIPSVVDHVRGLHPNRPIQWVGHSLGGVLLLCALIEHEGLALARGVTLCSALDYSVGGSSFALLNLARPLLRHADRVPTGDLSRSVAPLIGMTPIPFERMQVWPTNVENHYKRYLYREILGDLPLRLMTSLASAIDPGGLVHPVTGQRFIDLAQSLRQPVLMVAGSRDLQCPVDAVLHTAGHLPQARTLVLGRTAGQADDYAHFDALIGRRAPVEVWPHLVAFLTEDPEQDPDFVDKPVHGA